MTRACGYCKGGREIALEETLDSFFARTIAETAQIVALMGGRTVMAGMCPSVAITTTQLGLTLGGAMTALDVDRALDMLHHTHQRGRVR
jgi:rsbT antagonist protein RsbS